MKINRVVVVIESSASNVIHCVDSMKNTLGLGDKVVVVEPTERSGGPKRFSKRFGTQSVLVIQGDLVSSLRELAQELRPAEICMVEDSTLGARRWLDNLSDALNSLPANAVVAPRSPSIFGVQRVMLSEGVTLKTKGDLNAYARKFTESRRGHISSERYVSSMVLHMRTSHLLDVLSSIESCNKLVDLYLAIEEQSLKFISHDSLVYSLQARNVDVERSLSRGLIGYLPLLSACLIVKDEEGLIEDAIRSLLPIAEEVIVYDTGSSDNTLEIARSLGAKVIEGEWRGDFAWARNQALSACQGKWIVWIDADEVFECDPIVLRRELLFGDDEPEGYTVRIKNEVGSGMDTPIYHWATRMFRRSECLWSGAIHETIWSRVLDRSSYSKQCDFASIHHFGYLESIMTGKGKAERNIAVASASTNFRFIEEKKVHEARSYFLKGELSRCREIADEVVGSGSLESFRNLAIRVSFEASLGLGDFERASQMLGVAARSSIGEEFQSYMTAMLHMGRAQWSSALASLDEVGSGYLDQDGWEIVPEQLVSKRLECLVGLDRYDQAVDLALMNLKSGSFDFHLGRLVEWMRKSSEADFRKIALALPLDKLNLVFAQVLQLERAVADEVLEAFYEVPVLRVHVLATMGLIFTELESERALIWGRRISEAGFETAPIRESTGNLALGSVAK